MTFVLRKINPPGKSAMAHEATAVELLKTLGHGGPERGEYLEWADPDANNGMGDERWTADISKAKKFPSFAAALECWTEQSTVKPYRPDGKPNKPLTAWSVTVEPAP